MTLQVFPLAKEPTYAGLYLRMKAGLLDWMYCLFFVFAFLMTVMTLLVEGSWVIPTSAAISIMSAWLYFGLYESSASGATPGKKRYGLRVCDMEGNSITFQRASIRFAGKLLILSTSPFLLISIPFEPRRRAIHDLMAGTVVVDALQGNSTEGRSEAGANKFPDRRGYGPTFLLGLAIFVAASCAAYQFLCNSWSMPPDPVPSSFPVVMHIEGENGSTFESVRWAALENTLAEHPEWRLQLPAGKQFLDSTAEDGETDMFSFDVTAIEGGIRVEVSQRNGSYATEATYTVRGNEVHPEKMRLWHAMSLLVALMIGAAATPVLLWLRRKFACNSAVAP
jgi:uncharacterized RDD family membrane protein YckC